MSESSGSLSRKCRRDRAIASRLDRWFKSAARDLPWRRERCGYTALVAEAMLQQTQVSRVVERFAQFLKRFPTVDDLAAASEQDVLAVWQGLGYYRRARHLHAAAKQIVQEHNGEVPHTADSLQQLPGVGRYTAGAIASIVFGERVPIVDGNVSRVLARLEGKAGAARRREQHAWCWSRAEALVVSAKVPGACNEALMELGALICTPRQPRCTECPLASMCIARKRNQQHVIPEANGGQIKQTVHHHAVIIMRDDQLLIEQRPPDGLWASMWQAPTIEAARRLGPAEVRRRVERKCGGALSRCTRLDRFTHQTTHRRVEFDVFRADPHRSSGGTWQPISTLEDIPLGSPQRRIVNLVHEMC